MLGFLDQGNQVVEGLDVFENAQAFSLYTINFNNIDVLDGVLDIHLSADIYGVGYSAAGTFINAIEVMLENSLSADVDVPKEFLLKKPYPNPFNNNILIPITSKVKSDVVIEIFDINGKKVETILGLAGIGDLYVSAAGGRNSKMGGYLGRGFTFKTAKKNLCPMILLKVNSLHEKLLHIF